MVRLRLSPSRRPRRRRRGGRSARASTRWSSRRPGPARPWPRSCGPSTSWPASRLRPIPSAAAGCCTSRRSRRWPSTSSATCARRWPASRHAARRLGLPEPDIRVGVRTGDTAADERRKLASKPPDILITTPESLFLMLTSQAQGDACEASRRSSSTRCTRSPAASAARTWRVVAWSAAATRIRTGR